MCNFSHLVCLDIGSFGVYRFSLVFVLTFTLDWDLQTTGEGVSIFPGFCSSVALFSGLRLSG